MIRPTKYLDRCFSTSSGPDPPPPPPDPAIAEEKARREALALMMADRRRASQSGVSGTILTGNNRPGTTALTRPTEQLTGPDLTKTKVGKTNKQIDDMWAEYDSGKKGLGSMYGTDQGGNSPRRGGMGMLIPAMKEKMLRSEITEADRIAFKQAKADKSVAELKNRRRSRIGVTSTV